MGSIDFRRRTGVLGFRLQQRLRHDDTGLISYEDQQGNKMQINRDDVSQIIKR